VIGIGNEREIEKEIVTGIEKESKTEIEKREEKRIGEGIMIETE